jgi:glycosyltransferase involved in cell wall biosynthesis
MSLSNKDDIQVSVCVVTYNQEKYIAECLESLVTQQTSFKFEIIVGEDCSTDNTINILEKYKHLNNFHIFQNQENLGFNKNFELAI